MSSTKADFISENTSLVSFVSLKTNQQNISELIKYCDTNEKEFIKLALLKFHAFISPYKAGEVLAKLPNYSNEVKTMVQKLESASKSIIPSSEIVLELTSHLYDEEKFMQVFGLCLHTKPNSFYLSFDAFESSLNFIFNNSLGEHFKTKSKEYFEVLSDIKTEIVTSVFIEVKLENLLKYFCLLEIILKHITPYIPLKLYLIRDFIFFNIKLIAAEGSCYQLRKAALSAFNYYFDTNLILGMDIFKDYLSDLCRSLVSIVESVKEIDLRNGCLEVLKKLIRDNHIHFGESIERLDPFPNTTQYDDLREIYNKHHNQYCSDGLRGDIENFLRDFNRGADGLRSFKNNVSFFIILNCVE